MARASANYARMSTTWYVERRGGGCGRMSRPGPGLAWRPRPRCAIRRGDVRRARLARSATWTAALARRCTAPTSSPMPRVYGGVGVGSFRQASSDVALRVEQGSRTWIPFHRRRNRAAQARCRVSWVSAPCMHRRPQLDGSHSGAPRSLHRRLAQKGYPPVERHPGTHRCTLSPARCALPGVPPSPLLRPIGAGLVAGVAAQ